VISEALTFHPPSNKLTVRDTTDTAENKYLSMNTKKYFTVTLTYVTSKIAVQ